MTTVVKKKGEGLVSVPSKSAAAKPRTTTLAHSGLGSGTQQKRLKMLLWGPFGTRKTVSAHFLPNTRTLDLDDGMQSVEWAIRAGILTRPTWGADWTMQQKLMDIVYATILPPMTMDEAHDKVFDQAADQIEEWSKEEDIPTAEWEAYCREKTKSEYYPEGYVYTQFWDTLIIDSGSSLTSAVIPIALKEMDRLELSKSWSNRKIKGLTPVMIQDRGALNILFKKFMRLAFGTAKNVVLICHEYVNMDKKGNIIGYEPALSGQLRADVPKDFDEVWYCNIKGTAKQPKGVFQTQPDTQKKCRTRLGCVDPVIEGSDFSAIRQQVATFYGVSVDKLWVSPKGTAAAKEFLAVEAEHDVMV
ncbi:MAG: AAA family ATPase [Pyrinomonadaceae bacterium]